MSGAKKTSPYLLGHFHPALAVNMQPLGKAFIYLIKMIIAPLIFCTVVTGNLDEEQLRRELSGMPDVIEQAEAP